MESELCLDAEERCSDGAVGPDTRPVGFPMRQQSLNRTG
jgi:hypothetical protein